MKTEKWYYLVLATIVMMLGLWHIDEGAGGLVVGYDTMNFFGIVSAPTQMFHIGFLEVIISWIALIYLMLVRE